MGASKENKYILKYSKAVLDISELEYEAYKRDTDLLISLVLERGKHSDNNTEHPELVVIEPTKPKPISIPVISEDDE